MIVVKRISCFIALVCALLMGTASCSDDAVDIDEYTKQTLFVYMPWSGSETSSGLYSYFQVNLDSIERAIKRDKGLDGTRVLVFISNSANQSSLYEITYQNGDIAHVPVNDYAGQDYATTAGLSGLLNEVVAYAPRSQLCDDYRRTWLRMDLQGRLGRLSHEGFGAKEQDESCRGTSHDPLFRQCGGQ